MKDEKRIDYKKRVIEEKKELDLKLEKLTKFTQSANFVAVPFEEQGRMARQRLIMELYSLVLAERISAFQLEKK